MAAALDVSGERHIMHAITEADITDPRHPIREHREHTGEGLSLTAYVVACFARAVAEHPRLNSIRKGRNLLVFNDVTVVTMVEWNPEGEPVVELFGIRAADKKTYRQIHDEICAARHRGDEPVGTISGATRVRYIPSFLLQTFIRARTRNVRWAKRYGVVGVSERRHVWRGGRVGCCTQRGNEESHVGRIARRPVIVEGRLEEQEHLCHHLVRLRHHRWRAGRALHELVLGVAREWGPRFATKWRRGPCEPVRYRRSHLAGESSLPLAAI